MSTHYDVLGVSPGCTTRDIKAAYYRLARKYHPDRGVGADETAFKRALEAQSVLSDASQRRAYDAMLLQQVKVEHTRTATNGFSSYSAQSAARQAAARKAANDAADALRRAKEQQEMRECSARERSEKAARAARKKAAQAEEEAERLYRRRRTQETRWDRQQAHARANAESASASSRSNEGNKNTEDPFVRDFVSKHSRYFATGHSARMRNFMKDSQSAAALHSSDSDSSDISEDAKAAPKLSGDVVDISSDSSGEDSSDRPEIVYVRTKLDTESTASKREPELGIPGEERPNSPSKRRRFDLDDLRHVPPFTQTDGNFNLDALDSAIPRVTPRSRQYNRRTKTTTSPLSSGHYASAKVPSQTGGRLSSEPGGYSHTPSQPPSISEDAARIWTSFVNYAPATLQSLATGIASTHVSSIDDMLWSIGRLQRELEGLLADTQRASALLHQHRF